MSPRIDLLLAGPSEGDWDAALCDLSPFVWPVCDRVVVVSPHPDDETLGVGGMIATALDRGLDIEVLLVTDGEAAATVGDIAAVRRLEFAAALESLDPAGRIGSHRLAFDDGRVSRSVEELTDAIAERLAAADLVVCPVVDDGHPDHAATSIAATAAARLAGCVAARTFPVWAWHCHAPETSTIRAGSRLQLSDSALARKREAVGCYRSQTEGRHPIVPARMLTRLLRSFEVFVDVADQS